MIMETIDDNSEAKFTSEDLMNKFKGFFKDANLPQKRLMLRMTNSDILKASWID